MIPYIVHVAVILAGCLCFYKIFLQRETFYRLNRYVLLTCLAISFCLPLLRVPQEWSFRKSNPISVISENQSETLKDKTLNPQEGSVQNNASSANTEVTEDTPSLMRRAGTWLFYLYWFGVAVFGFNFLLQVSVLLIRSYSKPVIRDGKFRIVEMSGDKAPCSFGNTIFINPAKYEWETYNQILLHEKEHIRQQHSLDIVLGEIVLIFQWFNPFAWIYRKELESNLEFLTDNLILEKHKIDRSSYQMSLLKVSTPHLPLSVTTNYNQSLLKKRIVMMNAKKSNLHTTWKYFFLLPLLVLFVSLLNEPVAFGNTGDPANVKKTKTQTVSDIMDTEGSWFATIKNDMISFQFKSDEDDQSFNSSSFRVSEFSSLPKEQSGTFKLTREAGTMNFTGKFEGDQGMGRYKFTPDYDYRDQMKKEISETLDDRELLTFFFVNIKKDYVQMLKNNGYDKITKDDLIPLVALDIDQAFIRSLKENGYESVDLQELIPLKSLKIDGSYIREIKEAGYPNVSLNQLITFKAQGIDGKYITDFKKANGKNTKGKENNDADDLVAMKSLNVDAGYIQSWKDAGYSDIENNDLIAMKAMGLTPEFAKSFRAIGYKKIAPENLIAMKSQNISPEYISEFQSSGYKDIDLEDVVAMKSLGITSEYGKQFRDLGYDNISISKLIPLKAQNITAQFIKGFKDLGYTDVTLDEVISAKAMGVTPAFITSMKEKGHNFKTLEKYIQLKSILD
ncbi:MAG TPA: M56 family metallopeptidase [Flavitalea sp.]|nr:M56 family metallopeptidase [Flavitalea sp.]